MILARTGPKSKIRAPIKTLPGLDLLNRLFCYDPVDGVLRWKLKVRNGIEAGEPAGTITRRGYLQVGVHKRYYLVHRIIWKIMTGDEPISFVDHIDTNRLNNKWLNFRAADAGQNKSNGHRYKNNTSGVKGVCWDAPHQSWRAYISIDGHQKKLGRFKSLNVATATVIEARMRLHGEFARFE